MTAARQAFTRDPLTVRTGTPIKCDGCGTMLQSHLPRYTHSDGLFDYCERCIKTERLPEGEAWRWSESEAELSEVDPNRPDRTQSFSGAGLLKELTVKANKVTGGPEEKPMFGKGTRGPKTPPNLNFETPERIEPMPPQGKKMSAEHVRAMAEGRRRAREARLKTQSGGGDTMAARKPNIPDMPKAPPTPPLSPKPGPVDLNSPSPAEIHLAGGIVARMSQWQREAFGYLYLGL